MVYLPLVSANRDTTEFVDADQVVIDREGNRHIAFGAGPHRCLGSHLARQELRIGLMDWHTRIPDCRLPDGAEIVEHGGQIGLDNLPIVWDAPERSHDHLTPGTPERAEYRRGYRVAGWRWSGGRAGRDGS
jgi:cytochrome P450